MKAAVLTGLQQMEIRDVPKPQIQKDTDVLLKIATVGVCGSDVHYYETGRIGSQVVDYPYLVGHECAATVVQVGKAVKNLKIGEKIVVEPASSCHECDQCQMGRENTCRKLTFLGTPGQGDGCLCEYIVMPEECCFPVNESLTAEQAVLCEPFAIGVYAVSQAAVSAGAKIAVLGSGPIGLSCMAAAKAQGVDDVYMTDVLDYRVEVAAANGAIWAGNPEKQDIASQICEREPLGLDVVFECAGQQSTLDEAIKILRPGGKLVLIGAPRVERISFIIDKMRRKEITIINTRRQNNCTSKAIDLIASGKADVDFMVTHRFAFEQSKEAFDMVEKYADGVVKAVIEISRI